MELPGKILTIDTWQYLLDSSGLRWQLRTHDGGASFSDLPPEKVLKQRTAFRDARLFPLRIGCYLWNAFRRVFARKTRAKFLMLRYFELAGRTGTFGGVGSGGWKGYQIALWYSWRFS
jgi:hypothetical protein